MGFDFSANGLQLIGIILVVTVNLCPSWWPSLLLHAFAICVDDDDEEGDATGGKDWGDLGQWSNTVSRTELDAPFLLDGMFKQMGGGAGMGGGATDLNDLEDDGTDSDDEPMPDLEEVPKSDEGKSSTSENKETKN